MQRRLFLITMLFICLSLSAQTAATKRYGFFIGINNSGPDLPRLHYANSDAIAFSSVMEELGGIESQNRILLLDPSIQDIQKNFIELSQRISQSKNTARQVELVFYYSGHSDRNGLLLKDGLFSYLALRNVLDMLDSDVNVAILDSCNSEAFWERSKGGTFMPPFLIDEATKTRGNAFLSSSSIDQAAQESDSIQASFFTHYLISGLRGAADRAQDGKVSLHEAYSYAAGETLARTEGTLAGPQHPSYQFNLTGSQELILTDLRGGNSHITFDKSIHGRIFLRNSAGQLLAELRKIEGTPLRLVLPEDRYTIHLQNNTGLWETEFTLYRNANAELQANRFRRVVQELTVTRGTDTEENSEQRNLISELINDSIAETLHALSESFSDASNRVLSNENSLQDRINQRIEELTASRSEQDKSTAVQNNMRTSHISINLVSQVDNLDGIQIGLLNTVRNSQKGISVASIFNTIGGSSQGVQIASIFNTAGGDTKGCQVAGIFNTSQRLDGVQVAGIFNTSSSPSKGLQIAGIFNQSDNFQGMQISLLNTAKNMHGMQVGLVNTANIVYGTQIGLVNINDRIYGLPVGLINISRNGFFKLTGWREIGGLDSAGFQLGTNNLYTLFYAAKKPSPELWENTYLGMALGTRILQLGSVHAFFEAGFRRPFVLQPTWEVTLQETLSLSNMGNITPVLRSYLGYRLWNWIEFYFGYTLDARIHGFNTFDSVLHQGEQFHWKRFNTDFYSKPVFGFKF